MRPAGVAKVGFWFAVTGFIVAAGFGSTVTLSACGESGGCTKLRNDLYATKEKWDACDPADGPTACIKVSGNTRDCTGVLSCDFAVNPHHRAEAEQQVLTVGQQSQGCFLCATPNCIGGDIAYCEPISRRCIIVTTLDDAGGPQFGGDIDSGNPTPGNDATPDVAVPPDDSGLSDGAPSGLLTP